MASDIAHDAEGGAVSGSGADRKRDRSTIEFPYSDLESVVEVARELNNRTGGAPVDDAQLATWMNQTAGGGTFRTRMSSARLFGLLDLSQGRISLTPQGRDIIDDNKSASAKVEAFLRVPLYSAMYSQYQGYALPPPPAIERQMESLGVAPKVKDRARQAFTKSAQYAGFIDHQTGRFVKPALAPPPPGAGRLEDEVRSVGGGGGGGSGGGPTDLHPFILGLLKTLKEPGAEWPSQEQAKWLQTAASIFGLIYKSDGTITVTASEQ